MASKLWIINNVNYRSGFAVIPNFFSIVHARNTGAAFSLLHDADPRFVLPFFLVVGVVALGFILHMLRQVPAQRRLLPLLLGAVAGGALGNMIDRIRWGYVVDFLLFYIGNWSWPAFNIADIGISVGVVALILLSIVGRNDHLFRAPPAN